MREETEVLIVGLGPVGAALAVYLGSRDISAIAIERDTGVYPLPRAAHLDHETMRLLHLAGGAEAVAKASQPLSAYEFRNGAGELLMGFRPEGHLAPTGWPTSSMFHQPTLERALRARLGDIPCVSARLGHALSTYESDGEGIVATVAGPEGAYEVAARFIVGCDGGNSVVRRVARIALDDLGFDEPWLVIDTKLKDRDRLSTVGLQHCDPSRPVTSMPMAPGRHRWEFMLMPGETAEEVMSDEKLAAMLAPFADPASLDVERRAVYRFHALVAKQWRKGAVLLAGDAAHQMPPFMGQGLCSGVRDASNLAWKIEAMLRGRGGDALLDSYQPEREPHVRMITGMAMMMGKVVCTRNIDEAKARDAGMLAQPEAERMSPMIGLDGLKSGVLAGGGTICPEPRHESGRRLDDEAGYAALLIVHEDCAASRAFAAAGGTVVPRALLPDPGGSLAALMLGAPALLVRPDRYVFGAGEAPGLVAAWQAYLATGCAEAVPFAVA